MDTVTDGEEDGDVDCHETGQPRPGFVSFDRYMRGYYKLVQPIRLVPESNGSLSGLLARELAYPRSAPFISSYYMYPPLHSLFPFPAPLFFSSSFFYFQLTRRQQWPP